MRHRRRTKYFGVKTAHRKAMFRNMVTSLFRHGRITTTVTRAKELRRIADKLVSLAKEGSLHSRRQALSFIMDKSVVAKLFSDIAPKMADRRGGYTRIVRIGPRRGDGAMMCLIELVTESLKVTKPGKKKEEDVKQVAPSVIPAASTTEEDRASSSGEEESTGEVDEVKVTEEAKVEGDTETANEVTEDQDVVTDSTGDEVVSEDHEGSTTQAESESTEESEDDDSQSKLSSDELETKEEQSSEKNE